MKSMKRAMISLIVSAVFLLGLGVSGAVACYYCPPDDTGAGEVQGFVNMDATFAVGVVDQDYTESGFNVTRTDSVTVSGEGYGSIHDDPGVLFFGAGTINKEMEESWNVSRYCVEANTFQMFGSAEMGMNAGISADYNNIDVSGSAGASQTLVQGGMVIVPTGGTLGHIYLGHQQVETSIHN